MKTTTKTKTKTTIDLLASLFRLWGHLACRLTYQIAKAILV